MSDEPTRGRHRRPANVPARIAWVVATVVLWSVAFAGGWTFQATAAASDGEPKEVVVATWMRDNHMGWAVAQLENLYYRYVVPPQVGGTPAISADIAGEDLAGLSASSAPASAPTPTPTPIVSTGRPAAPATATPSGDGTPNGYAPSSSSASARPHLMPPAPIPVPVPTPEPKEGIWQPVGSRIDDEAAIYVTRVRADSVHTAYYASVMWIDTLLTKAMFVPGYEEPAGGPNPFNGALPEEFWPIVMANFNGAFRLEDSMGGYYYDGEMVAPLVNGKGTTVVYRDGSIKIGKWGRDLTMGADVMAVRQNLSLIVDRGESKVNSASDNVVWGATTDKESLAWRAAIGQRPDGSIIYVGSPYLSAQGLADTLVGAGVEEAMVLDMNTWWTAGFYFRHQADGAPLCRKLDPSIAEGCDRFLHPYKRDSFQFLSRFPINQ